MEWNGMFDYYYYRCMHVWMYQRGWEFPCRVWQMGKIGWFLGE